VNNINTQIVINLFLIDKKYIIILLLIFDKQTTSSYHTHKFKYLWGRVQFPTGGIAHEPSSNARLIRSKSEADSTVWMKKDY